MRPLRHPLPGGLYEISSRATGNALLTRPSKEVNEIILGVIGRAQTMYAVQLHALVFLSNHYHLLLSVPDSRAMSGFLQFVNGNIARKLNILHERDGTFWERRFRAIPIAPDRATQLWRLRYLLAHGAKEGLVGRVEDWPGASSLPWLRDGKRLFGVWQDRTKLYYAKRIRAYVEDPDDFKTEYEVKLTVLPCWRRLAAATWRRLVHDVIAELNEEAHDRVAAGGAPPLGAEVVLATDPFRRVHSKRGRAPSVLSRDRKVGLRMVQELRARVEQWREAAAAAMALLSGEAGTTAPLPAMYWRVLQV